MVLQQINKILNYPLTLTGQIKPGEKLYCTTSSSTFVFPGLGTTDQKTLFSPLPFSHVFHRDSRRKGRRCRAVQHLGAVSDVLAQPHRGLCCQPHQPFPAVGSGSPVTARGTSTARYRSACMGTDKQRTEQGFMSILEQTLCTLELGSVSPF